MAEVLQGPVVQAVARSAIGAALGALEYKVREKLLENPSVLSVYERFGEWGDAIVGAAIIAAYELLRGYVRIENPFVDSAVYGVGIVMMSNAFETALGKPFIIITSDGKLKAVNIDPLPNAGYLVVFKGSSGTITAKADPDGTLHPDRDITEGVYDVAAIGDGKAASIHQHVPTIKATAGTGGATQPQLKTATASAK